MTTRLYNSLTWLKYRILHRPLRMQAVFDRRVVQPRLTVIFLHGISATSTTWSTTLRQFAKNTDLTHVRLIALDLLGFGKSLHSDWLDYDYREYHTALENTCRKLHITGPVILVGHSMGALIAANYAVQPHRALDIMQLVLVSPPVLMAAEVAKLPDRIYTKSYGALNQLAKDQPAVDVIAHFIQRFSSFRKQYLKTAAFGKSMENIILNPQNYRDFTQLRLPTLIIHGRFDPLVLTTNLKKAAKQNSKYLQLVEVMGQHDISAQKRAKILKIIKENLQYA